MPVTSLCTYFLQFSIFTVAGKLTYCVSRKKWPILCSNLLWKLVTTSWTHSNNSYHIALMILKKLVVQISIFFLALIRLFPLRLSPKKTYFRQLFSFCIHTTEKYRFYGPERAGRLCFLTIIVLGGGEGQNTPCPLKFQLLLLSSQFCIYLCKLISIQTCHHIYIKMISK